MAGRQFRREREDADVVGGEAADGAEIVMGDRHLARLRLLWVV
jgi:hypothetical protein